MIGHLLHDLLVVPLTTIIDRMMAPPGNGSYYHYVDLFVDDSIDESGSWRESY
ncbi:hypothetical protein [Rhodococcus sp. SORGH_AS_0303]|uniref:hypothetical protein n=1 Tax=Rhodococcus sp. SORGH_AS_0303 TaxID=3041753 RepID=UPI0027860B20|nr:hypothetical protein [Rhodococcus sp. SORGH_AS_0303]MDQ1200654.1 hypothetical protein [Rhodococcus sp. SORGH_AS_0303]